MIKAALKKSNDGSYIAEYRVKSCDSNEAFEICSWTNLPPHLAKSLINSDYLAENVSTTKESLSASKITSGTTNGPLKAIVEKASTAFGLGNSTNENYEKLNE